ncbi:sulfurtransferase [Rhodovulum iodosum]|nr:sulfurtransferase [Rhodovulum robiginosum]
MRAEAGELTLLDIRSDIEVERSGKANGAVHIPVRFLRAKADPKNPKCHPGLKPDVPVAIYCASGSRSVFAGRILMKMGYARVYNLGSLNDWQRAGGRCER